jgi:hypothetical protein
VDGSYYSLAFLVSKVSKQLHDRCCSEAIKPGCWFIKKYDRWVGDQLDTDGCALSFAS